VSQVTAAETLVHAYQSVLDELRRTWISEPVSGALFRVKATSSIIVGSVALRS